MLIAPDRELSTPPRPPTGRGHIPLLDRRRQPLLGRPGYVVDRAATMPVTIVLSCAVGGLQPGVMVRVTTLDHIRCAPYRCSASSTADSRSELSTGDVSFANSCPHREKRKRKKETISGRRRTGMVLTVDPSHATFRQTHLRDRAESWKHPGQLPIVGSFVLSES
jgi:hypothetical protein